MRERVICSKDSCPQGNAFHKNSTILELPDGDLLAAWMANPPAGGHEHDGGRYRSHDQNIYGARLPADADEWEDPECWANVPDRALSCPVLFEGPDGGVWLAFAQQYGNSISASRLFLKRSFDGGATWTDAEMLTDTYSLYLHNKPLHLEEEDRWLLGVYHLHGTENKPGFLVIPGDYTERPGDFPPLVGGDEIVPKGGYDPEDIYMGTQGLVYPTAVELSDGCLLAYMRPRPGGHLWETRSHDRGWTWTEAEETAIPNPNTGFDLLATESGTLVLVNNPTVGDIPEGRNELALFASDDEGQTWPHQFYVEREALERPLAEQAEVGRPEFSYGNLIEGRDGTIHLTYEYRRKGLKHVEFTEDELRERGGEPIVPKIA